MATTDLSTFYPSLPDFYGCHPYWGNDLTLSDCMIAANKLDASTIQTQYYLNAAASRVLPFTVSHGACNIAFEAAGPAAAAARTNTLDTLSIDLVPSDLRDTAAYVVQNCVGDAGGEGGFATLNLEEMLFYLRNPDTSFLGSFRKSANYYPGTDVRSLYSCASKALSTTFVTVVVSNKSNEASSPGNYDPSMPIWFGAYAVAAARTSIVGSPSERFYLMQAAAWTMQSMAMSRGGTTSWYETESPTSDLMTYECDVNLGSPSITGCTDIEWNQLGVLQGTLSVGPGNTKFLKSNTCYLAISASIAMVLSWAQIHAAVSTLMNICISPAFQAGQGGGRAYYGAQPQTSSRIRRDVAPLSGLNALPLQANITIFEQTEPYSSPQDEINGCTWQAVLNGQSVFEQCQTA